MIQKAYSEGFQLALEKLGVSFGGSAGAQIDKAMTPVMTRSVDNIKNLATKGRNMVLGQARGMPTPPITKQPQVQKP